MAGPSGRGAAGENAVLIAPMSERMANLAQAPHVRYGEADGRRGIGWFAVGLDGDELPHVRPAAARRAFFDQPTAARGDGERPALFQRRRPRLSARGNFLLQRKRKGAAVCAQRTRRTFRIPRRADRRAQFHQGGIEIANVSRGQDFLGASPEPLVYAGIARFAAHCIQAAQDARDIPVEDRGAIAERDGSDRACGVPADAGQFQERFDVLGNVAVALGDDVPGCRQQIAAARIISQALPKAEHGLLVGGREIGQRRKFIHKPHEIWDNGGHLRLLKHDFADQDVVWIGRRRPPRQIAPVTAVPTQEPGLQRRRHRD